MNTAAQFCGSYIDYNIHGMTSDRRVSPRRYQREWTAVRVPSRSCFMSLCWFLLTHASRRAMDCHVKRSASRAVLYSAVNWERGGPCFPADLLCLKGGTKGPIKKSINKVAGGKKNTHTVKEGTEPALALWSFNLSWWADRTCWLLSRDGVIGLLKGVCVCLSIPHVTSGGLIGLLNLQSTRNKL